MIDQPAARAQRGDNEDGDVSFIFMFCVPDLVLFNLQLFMIRPKSN